MLAGSLHRPAGCLRRLALSGGWVVMLVCGTGWLSMLAYWLAL
jgi:hypothetical protein